MNTIIPVGFCQCGCGQRTAIAEQSRTNRGWIKGEPKRYALHHGPVRRGPDHVSWRGGRLSNKGYIKCSVPDHPRATSGYVFEHILIVERAMGKLLRPTAPVHHVDSNRANNANTNLVACDSNAYHKLLHQRQHALDACGDPNALSCEYCHGYDRQDDLAIRKRRGGGRRACHRTCAAKAQADRRARIHDLKMARPPQERSITS